MKLLNMGLRRRSQPCHTGEMKTFADFETFLALGPEELLDAGYLSPEWRSLATSGLLSNLSTWLLAEHKRVPESLVSQDLDLAVLLRYGLLTRVVDFKVIWGSGEPIFKDWRAWLMVFGQGLPPEVLAGIDGDFLHRVVLSQTTLKLLLALVEERLFTLVPPQLLAPGWERIIKNLYWEGVVVGEECLWANTLKSLVAQGKGALLAESLCWAGPQVFVQMAQVLPELELLDHLEAPGSVEVLL